MPSNILVQGSYAGQMGDIARSWQRDYMDLAQRGISLEQYQSIVGGMQSMGWDQNRVNQWLRSMPQEDIQKLMGGITPAGSPTFFDGGGREHGRYIDQTTLDTLRGWAQNNGNAPALTKEQQYLRDNQDRIQQFIQHMMSPINPHDPDVAPIVADIRSRASTEVSGRGGGGGMADASINKVMADSLLGMQQQRQQVGLAAAQGQIGDERSFLAAQDQAKAALAAGQYQNQVSQYETQRGALQGILGMAGGVIGGMYGGAGGMSLGSQLGSSVGGMMAGGPPAQRPYSSSYYGTGSYGRGGSSGGMSGGL
jgi:hypothetical protein